MARIQIRAPSFFAGPPYCAALGARYRALAAFILNQRRKFVLTFDPKLAL